MTYYDVSNLSDDHDFRARCTAALATEQHPTPEQQAYAWRWQYAGQPGFGDAYAYAILTGVEHPGRDEAVITDGQILSATQALMFPPEVTPIPAETMLMPNESWTEMGIKGWLVNWGVHVSRVSTNLSKAELLDLVRDVLDVP